MNAIMLAGSVAAALHITPTVVLIKRVDAVRRLAPDAQSFTAREVHLSEKDAHRLHEAVDWSPEEGVLTFYTGKRGGAANGVFLFIRVDSQHGPVEAAVAFEPSGRVRAVIVTKATVETRPWMEEALGAGLLEHYRGLRAGDAVEGAAAIEQQVGKMPAYIAGQVDKAVARALAAYHEFYR